jgi:hypothetical protein
MPPARLAAALLLVLLHEPQSHPGSGKCCSAHTFLMELGLPIPSAAPEELAHGPFVARWTNFIPEEPSPPPIASLRSA